jgi:hypothetical protein
VSGPSAEHLRNLWSELGAVLTGRRIFEVARSWDGNHAWGPAFVLIRMAFPPDGRAHARGHEGRIPQPGRPSSGKSPLKRPNFLDKRWNLVHWRNAASSWAWICPGFVFLQ